MNQAAETATPETDNLADGATEAPATDGATETEPATAE